MGRKVYVFAGLLLLIVSIAGGYYFEKLRKKEIPLIKTPVNVGVRQIAVLPTDYVKKLVGDKGSQKIITYEIQGSFLGNVKQIPYFLEGEFVIKGDVKERKIKTYLGSNIGTVLFGKYNGSFAKDSQWEPARIEEVAGVINDGEPVLLTVEFIADETHGNLESIAKDEKILDAYIDAGGGGAFVENKKLPKSLRLRKFAFMPLLFSPSPHPISLQDVSRRPAKAHAPRLQGRAFPAPSFAVSLR